MLTKQNYGIGALVGFFAGVFAIPVFFNLGIKQGLILAAFPMIVPPLFVFGIWFSNFLSRFLPFMSQFGRFIAVGFLNTAIDFGILNLLSLTTGITKGFIIGGVNAPGFAVAIVNSYFWNKLWVFKNRDLGETLFHDFPKFIAVSMVGLFLNSGIIVLITTFIPPFFGLSGEVWLNIAKALATGMVLTWNFVGYKFLVFNSKQFQTC